MRYLKLLLQKPLFITFFTLFVSALATGQIHEPVTWEFDSKPLENGEFELLFKADIEPGWHLYGTDIPEDGPIPTSFVFEDNEGFELIGELQTPVGITKDDPVFMMTLTYFDLQAVFVQKVRALTENVTVKGELEFMTCDDEKCLPPELLEFDFQLKKSNSPARSSSRSEPKPDAQGKGKSTSPESKDSKNKGEKEESGILKPVTWSFEHKRIGNREFEIIARAATEGKWHIYSAYLPEDDGPVATEFNILNEAGIKEVSEILEVGDIVTEFDENFQLDLSYFKKNGTVIRRVKIDKDELTLPVEIYFMTCDDKRCLTPEGIEHEFKLSNNAQLEKPTKVNERTGEDKPEAKGKQPVDNTETGGQRSLWVIFLLSFGGGFAALLTPCVFPMIPMTVSFFTKQSKTRAKGISNAIIYGISIIALYTLLGFAITYFFGADALNAMSTNEWFNFAFFVLLMIFGISFLGAFEITLPSSWVNKADRASDRGGLIGIFFMAVTLSLVSFSCTGPIIGTLLVDAAVHGGIMGPLIGMFGFSLALALPFGLFAAFPGWLNAMPKSGGWLNTVKVVLGFLEIALAFKFLSNADLVLQLGIITREVFLAIWIGVMVMLAIYLLGMIRMPHDSPLEKLSVGRTMFATLVVVFIIYLIPGMWGAPLKIISGFPPPMHYSESPQGVGFMGGGAVSAGKAVSVPDGADPDKCPHNLNCFKDYEKGMKYAREVNKPVLLDFTGHACVNCRKMEEQVWSDTRVLEILREDVVLISLYVDERKKLPVEEQFVSEVTGKKVKTVGNKWSAFQAERFGTNSQPYYQFVNVEGEAFGEPAAYDPNISKYIDWLESGIELFEKQKK